MIVEVAVIGGLTFHVLFNIGKFPLPFLEFSMEHLQFSPCPFYSIPASVQLDLSGFSQGEFSLTSSERLC